MSQRTRKRNLGCIRQSWHVCKQMNARAMESAARIFTLHKTS